MTIIDPSLSLRRAFAALADSPLTRASPRQGEGSCPEPDRLWRAVAAELPAEERRALVDHTAACPACAEAWRLARDLAPTAHAGGLGPPAHAHPLASSWWGSWASLAAAALAVATTLAILPPRAPSAFRDARQGAVRSLVADGAELRREQCVLRWTPGPAGTRYNLQVATGRLVAVHRALGLETPVHQVPAAALAGLPPGSTLLWQVESVAADGSRTASPTFVSRLE